MTATDTRAAVHAALVKHLGLHPGEITDEKNLILDLAMDEIDGIEVAMTLETALAITLADGAIASCATVGDLVALADRQKAAVA